MRVPRALPLVLLAAGITVGRGLEGQARHWPRGVYVVLGADGALLHPEETREPVGAIGPAAGVGVALSRHVSVELNLRRVRYPAPESAGWNRPGDFDLRYLQVAIQPVVALYHSPYASLYGGPRVSLNRKTTENTRIFLDPAVSGGLGLGLVAGVRALWGSRLGFDVAAYGEGQWFGDLVAGGARVPGTGTNAAWFGMRALAIAFPF